MDARPPRWFEEAPDASFEAAPADADAAPGRPDAPPHDRPADDRPRYDRAAYDRGPRPPRGPNVSGGPRRFDRGYDRGPAPRRPMAPSVEAIRLGEDEELVAGRRPVEEAFVARREARRLYVVPQRRMALEKLVLHATNLRIPVVEVEGGSLTAVAGFDGHQGIALVVAPRRWASTDDILAAATQRGEAPLVLVLDSLEDPQNVGTLLRTAEAQGAHGAVFPTHRQAPLTPAAVKASAGAVEHLRLAPVDDLAGALADLHVRGLRIVGADGDAPLTAREVDLRGPVAIVVGSEGRGLGPAVRRRCDLLVRIPMHGRIESLNAAVAGSILMYEAAAQRGLAEAPPPVPEAEAPSALDADTGGATAELPAPDEPVVAPEPAPKPKRTRAKAVPAAEPAAGPDDAHAEAAPVAEPVPKPARTRAKAAPAEPVPTAAPEPKPKRSRAKAAPTPDADDELLPGGPPVDAPAAAVDTPAGALGDGPGAPAEPPAEV